MWFGIDDVKQCQIYWKIPSNLLTQKSWKRFIWNSFSPILNINPEFAYQFRLLSETHSIFINFQWNEHHNWQSNIFTMTIVTKFVYVVRSNKPIALWAHGKMSTASIIQIHNRKIRTLISRWQVRWQPQNMPISLLLFLLSISTDFPWNVSIALLSSFITFDSIISDSDMHRRWECFN